jgi:hypothetical protein
LLICCQQKRSCTVSMLLLDKREVQLHSWWRDSKTQVCFHQNCFYRNHSGIISWFNSLSHLEA